MTEPTTIRRLNYSDLPQVIAVERRVFPTPWSLAMFVLELSKPGGICLAALRGERLVGYLVCSRYDTVWHLMNVAVDDRLQRQGIATALLRRLFDRADRPGAEFTLEVRPSNRGAIALYERFGFRAAGRRRGYYHDNKEDALIMWRTVGEGPVRGERARAAEHAAPAHARADGADPSGADPGGRMGDGVRPGAADPGSPVGDGAHPGGVKSGATVDDGVHPGAPGAANPATDGAAPPSPRPGVDAPAEA